MASPNFNKLGGLLGKIANALINLGAFGLEGAQQQAIAQGLDLFENKILKGISKNIDINAKEFTPLGSIGYWNKINQEIMNVNQGLGIGGDLSENIQKSFRMSLKDAAELGAEYGEVVKEYKAFTEELGRNRQFTSQEFVQLVEYQKLFGDSAADIFATYNKLGVSFDDITKSIQQIGIDSNRIGVSYSKVIQELKKNLSVINRLSFDKGRRGMEKMAELAVKTRISMSSAAGFADKIFDEGIEGAIEMGANLQMLGGEMAQLGDPFELYYLARNAPEELTARLAEATKNVAALNRQTGEIEINAQGMQRLRELSKTTGVQLEELAESARVASKEAAIEGRFDFSMRSRENFDEMLSKVAGLAEYDANLDDFVVNIGDQAKRIGELTPEMIGELDFVGTEKVTDVNERIIKANESLEETLNRLIQQLKITTLEGVQENYQRIYDVSREFADNVRGMMKEGGLAEAIKAFQALSSASFDNFMNVFEKLAKGDVAGAGSAAMNNITAGLEGIISAVGEAAKALGRIFIGGIQYLGSYIVAGINNAIRDLGVGIGAQLMRAADFWGNLDRFSDDQLRSMIDISLSQAGFERSKPMSAEDAFRAPIEDFLKYMSPDSYNQGIKESLDKFYKSNDELIQNNQTIQERNREIEQRNMRNQESMRQSSRIGQTMNITHDHSGTITLNTGGNLTKQQIKELSEKMNKMIEENLTSQNRNGGKPSN